MGVSAAEVKRLREKTGAGPLECKKSLEETNGDFDLAEKRLKEKGLAAVEKRADRAANEGKIFVHIQGNMGALVELSTETDFVARNPEFIALGETIVARVLEKGYTEIHNDLTGLVADLAAKIGENMSLKRIKLVKAEANEYLTQYIHGEGTIGVLVKLRGDKPEVFSQEEAKEFAFTIALHITAFNPLALDKSAVHPEFLKEQEDIFRKQMEGDESLQGKPAPVIENILKGKVKKYLSEICLLDQGYVKDDSLTVAQALAEWGKKLGTTLTISDYVYFKVGE